MATKRKFKTALEFIEYCHENYTDKIEISTPCQADKLVKPNAMKKLIGEIKKVFNKYGIDDFEVVIRQDSDNYDYAHHTIEYHGRTITDYKLFDYGFYKHLSSEDPENIQKEYLEEDNTSAWGYIYVCFNMPKLNKQDGFMFMFHLMKAVYGKSNAYNIDRMDLIDLNCYFCGTGFEHIQKMQVHDYCAETTREFYDEACRKDFNYFMGTLKAEEEPWLYHEIHGCTCKRDIRGPEYLKYMNSDSDSYKYPPF